MAALPMSGSRIARVAQRPPGSGARFTNGDTLIARITPCLENGKTAYVDCLPNEAVGWGSTEFIVLRPLGDVPRALPYLIARHEPFRAHLIAAMSGTSGRQRVQADAVDRWEIAIPPPLVLRSFDELVGPMFARVKALGEENATLAALRDTLLPKLISGELRVRDAEAIAAAA
jgi:type I restriction enzyme S subunit